VDLSTTTNWINGSAADEFYNLDTVRFDTLPPTAAVTITGTVQPATVLVTNNSARLHLRRRRRARRHRQPRQERFQFADLEQLEWF